MVQGFSTLSNSLLTQTSIRVAIILDNEVCSMILLITLPIYQAVIRSLIMSFVVFGHIVYSVGTILSQSASFDSVLLI